MSAPTLTLMLFDKLVRTALEEDLGRAGDITTLATIPAGTRAIAVMAARKAGVISGLPVAQETFRQIDPSLKFEILHADGSKVEAGTALARISGEARSILTAERVALNFVSRMCGTATLTARHAELIAHTKAKVCCTRKTTPGLRALEKYAVRCGGGMNHRFGLDDAILIKDNHVAVAGGVGQAVGCARAAGVTNVICEIDSLDQIEPALAAGATHLLLDNMVPDMLRVAVALVGGRAPTEASGGVLLDTIGAIAATGVTYVSVGRLTQSAPAADIGLDFAAL